MTQEDKELLLKDLCARLFYGVKISLQYGSKQLNGVLDAVYPTEERIIVDELSEAIAPINVRYGGFKLDENTIMPYLRSMSSMTEEEAMEYANCGNIISNSPQNNYLIPNPNCVDWLNAYHFDYRGLIGKGLALEAKEGIYNI